MTAAAEAIMWFAPWLVIIGLAATMDRDARLRRSRRRAQARARRRNARALRELGVISPAHRAKLLNRGL